MTGLDDWEHEPSGMTDRELFNRYGYLSPGRQERLIDIAERVEGVEDLSADVLDDAASAYPEEDCLQLPIDQLRKPKDPTGDLADVIEQLEKFQAEQAKATEYEVEIIRDFQNEVNKI